MTEPGLIERSEWIAPPPAQVWAALTEPARLAKWWVAGNIRPVVGHCFALDMGPWGPQTCEILAVEPEWFISFAFAPGTLDTTITWRLAPEDGGTRLFLGHRGFNLDTPQGKVAFQGMRAGWPAVLARINMAPSALSH